MKIVHICVCGNFSEKYAYQDNLLPKYHRKSGNDVTIVAPQYGMFDKNTGKVIIEDCGTKYLEDGIKLIRIKSFLPASVNGHVHFFSGLMKVIEAEKPELLFVHGVECPNYRGLYQYHKKNPEVKIVFDNHTDFTNSQHNIISKIWAKTVIKRFIVPKLLKVSGIFYGTTQGRCDFLCDEYGVPKEKVRFLPMGADDEFLHLEKRNELRKQVRDRYSIREDDLLLVTGGKIDSYKNVDVLCEAVSDIDNHNIKLLIFGSIEDSLKPNIEAMLSDRIIYCGWVASNDVYKFFYAADLVIFPGRHSVLWEQAVASKTPIAYSGDKNFSHIDFNGNCIVISPINVDNIRHRLSYLATNRDEIEKFKSRAVSDKAEEFLYSKIANKVIEDIKNE